MDREGMGERKRGRLGRFFVVALAAAACGLDEPGSEVLRELPEGTLRGDVLSALGPGPLPEEVEGWFVQYGYRVEQYLVDGESWEVVWVTDPAFAPEDSLDLARQTPVLLHQGAFHSWGWEALERAHEEKGLPLPAPEADADGSEDGEGEVPGPASS